MWGMQIPKAVAEPYLAVWGARAICSHNTLDLLNDRQSAAGPRCVDLARWVNQSVIPACNNWLKNIDSGASTEMFFIGKNRYGFWATPNASHGYVYCSAWECREDEEDRVAKEVFQTLKARNKGFGMSQRKFKGMEGAQYELATLPAWCPGITPAGGTFNWSNTKPPPAIGDRVRCLVNDLGAGIVISYYTEDHYLGVEVWLESPPTWFVKQNPGENTVHVFGSEVEVNNKEG